MYAYQRILIVPERVKNILESGVLFVFGNGNLFQCQAEIRNDSNEITFTTVL